MKQINVINIHVGKMLQDQRKKCKYSQGELASAVGLTRTSIVNIEKGRQGMTIEILLKCCAVLKCKTTNILPKPPTVALKAAVKQSKIVSTYKVLDANFKW